MIAGLRGNISHFIAGAVILDTGSVFYEVQIPLTVMEVLSRKKKDEKIELFIYHYFSQNDERLYGFLDPVSRELFREMIALNGVGPVLALSLLSHLSMENFIEIAEGRNAEILEKIPRVGKKTAEVLLFEIKRSKNKFLKIISIAEQKKEMPVVTSGDDLVIEALLQLGYREASIKKALEQIPTEIDNTADRIRQALRFL